MIDVKSYLKVYKDLRKIKFRNEMAVAVLLTKCKSITNIMQMGISFKPIENNFSYGNWISDRESSN